MMTNKELFILSPFQIPNVKLVLQTIHSGAYPILHLGNDESIAQKALDTLSKTTDESFGVCYSEESSIKLQLPVNVKRIIYPYGLDIPTTKNIEVFCQVTSSTEARDAVKNGIKNIIVKGNEGAGKVGNKSSFILFQEVMAENKNNAVSVYIQGGIGIHTSAAAVALGARGIIMDNQIALFPECSVPESLKKVVEKLSGSETVVINNFRVLLRKNSPILPVNAVYSDIKPYLGGMDIEKNLIPMGQDISLAVDLREKYKNLKGLVSGFNKAIYGHLQQAKTTPSIKANSKLAKKLNIKYPIAQGPMARVSDVPLFAKNIADGGALPFLALSMMSGSDTGKLLTDAQTELAGKAWGVGILGFAPAEIREKQIEHILETKPSVVLIAGGRPSLAAPFEKAGMKVFLHVPSSSLLDMFIKEGARSFIFEGRESGGHIAPLSSMVIWEKQIYRLLKEDNLSLFDIFFAGGIHDSFSSAFISIMAATLVARGANVGVLMGSSYLYTEEAVTSGAILPEYQHQAIEATSTVILETSPGQETRSVKSSFTALFEDEKKKLQAQGIDNLQIRLELENLNLGRLRIAAKGIERDGSRLIKLNEKEQAEKGLYMIGQIVALHDKVINIDQLHENVAIDNNELILGLPEIELPKIEAKPLDVAIVGIACVFPDAHNLEEYWRNIVLGKNSITEVPDSRWNKDVFYDPDSRDTDNVVSKWGGFIPTIDFDPLEFGMPPQSLASIEPTQLLSLYVAKRALSDAGYTDLSKIDMEDTSVIFGAEGATELAASYGFRAHAKQVFGELPDTIKNALPRLDEDSFAGVLSNVISGRIANRLNLGGRNYTVDAACASSMAALDLGCQELASNRSDMVLLGGADLHNGINDFLMFSCTHALSKKGYSASFDAESDGIALGEGIGVLVLKRLADAERDGNKIYAVVKGVGGSSDGKSLGMTAPNKTGQAKALERAYSAAGILPSQVGMIEAHGTGTVVGDKTELSALTNMFLESGAVKGQSLLGSVKTQIGHAKCAAGIAGVIKTAMSLYHGVQPPTLHLNQPNPFYDKDSSPFVFNKQSGIWNSDRRIAGVSAFGFGGTNFHAVLESYKNSPLKASTLPLWPSELFVFRGNSINGVKQQLQNIKAILEYDDNISIKDIAYSLAVSSDKDIQVSIVAKDTQELLQKLKSAIADKSELGVYFRDVKEGKVAFMFSGQGSQRVNMARDLFVIFPAMRKGLAANKEYEKIIFPDTVFDDVSKKEQQKAITDTCNAQPLLGLTDIAIANYLKSLGIVPDMVAGHSYGEIPALCFAGVFDENNLVELSRKRALSILNAIEEDKGKMLAVSMPEEKLKVLLDGETEVWAVNFNSQKQIVLAGTTAGITAFVAKLNGNNLASKELNVACAFHSPLLHKSEELYSKVLADVEFSTPNLAVWSNTTAELYPEQVDKIKNRLSEHLVKPVLFTKQVENMYNDGARVFIESGPGSVLTGLVGSMLGNDVITIETESKNINGVTFLLNSIAKYIATGRSVDVAKLFEDRDASVINLEEPSQYQKKATIWYIDGHNAVPSNGKMPAQGAYPVTKPLMDLKNIGSNTNIPIINANSSSDQIVMEYLDNMRIMLQNQRDVMLGYLGYEVPTQSVGYTSTPIQNRAQNQLSSTQISSSVQPTTIKQMINTPVSGVITNTPQYTTEDVKAMLLGIVSEKTGYPTDMLGLDLDLESDLSIDSIKRMEIIGTLRERLNITGNMEEAEGAIEKMAAIKTLNGLITWIEELAESSKGQAPATTNTTVTSASVATTSTPQYTTEDVKVMLLDIVSEKTGYPTEMLGLDLDLESDLSIDSIKRMEIIGTLRERLNISGNMEEAEGAIEKMAAIKTLNGLIIWIEELAESSKGQAPANTTKVVSSASVATINTPQYTTEDVKVMLLDIVSEKTGYPTEMLGLDLDLESDLSIDSIKRMEIIGTLRERLNISGNMEEAEGAIEKMASLKTLNGLITWIEELGNEHRGAEKMTTSDNSSNQADSNIVSTSQPIENDHLIRMTFELTNAKLDEDSIPTPIKGQRFALTDDKGEYAKAVKIILEENGATVDIIEAHNDLSPYNGLIILNPSKASQKYDIEDVFNMIKNTDLSNIKWIYTFSDLLGNVEKIEDLKGVQGFAGLIKSLRHEYPSINFRTVISHSVFDTKALPQIVLDELSIREQERIEIVYEGTKRYFSNPVATALSTDTKANLGLDENSVVVVFGGGQGITPELLSELAKDYPCNYILVGRSEKPSIEFDKYRELATKNDIRKYLISQEGMRSPGEIEKKVQRIYKGNQLISNIEKIEKSGGKVTYKSLDIKNEEALRNFIKDTYKSYGKIDGVFHAAGLLEDKLFSQKTFESFNNVYATKIIPLHVLLEELHSDIKVFVMFSSVASSYGNKGQTDYASANSIFDLIAPVLKEKLNAKILTINWGPWKGTGMVSDSLEAEFEKRGVSLIQLNEGAKYFVNELKYGQDTNVFVMGGSVDVKNALKLS